MTNYDRSEKKAAELEQLNEQLMENYRRKEEEHNIELSRIEEKRRKAIELQELYKKRKPRNVEGNTTSEMKIKEAIEVLKKYNDSSNERRASSNAIWEKIEEDTIEKIRIRKEKEAEEIDRLKRQWERDIDDEFESSNHIMTIPMSNEERKIHQQNWINDRNKNAQNYQSKAEQTKKQQEELDNTRNKKNINLVRSNQNKEIQAVFKRMRKREREKKRKLDKLNINGGKDILTTNINYSVYLNNIIGKHPIDVINYFLKKYKNSYKKQQEQLKNILISSKITSKHNIRNLLNKISIKKIIQLIPEKLLRLNTHKNKNCICNICAPIQDSQIDNVIKIIEPLILNNIIYYDNITNIYKYIIKQIKII